MKRQIYMYIHIATRLRIGPEAWAWQEGFPKRAEPFSSGGLSEGRGNKVLGSEHCSMIFCRVSYIVQFCIRMVYRTV